MNIKKIISVALCALIFVSLVGCSSATNLTPSQASKYVVTLGNYKGLSADLTTEANAKNLKETLKSSSTSKDKITDRAVAKGDIVNIDYEGVRLDTNVVFQGGTASGYDLEIGSKTFIDGFEDGLVGAKPGETIKLNLKFPKDYKNNVSLADKDVVFTVTINHIVGYSEEDIKRCEDSVAASIILQTILESTTFSNKMPTALINERSQALINDVRTGAATAGMDLTSYLKNYYQMTEEDFKTKALTYATTTVKQEIILLAIANDANITLSDDEYKTRVAEEAKKYGYGDQIDEFVKAYGGKDDVRKTLLMTKITDYVLSVSEIKK